MRLSSRLVGFALLTASLAACQKNSSNEGVHLTSFKEFSALEASGEVATGAPESSSCTDTKMKDVDPDQPDLSCKNLRQEFRYVVYVGKQIYCYWDFKKADTLTDYDQLAVDLESKITDQITLAQYFRDVLRPWAASLHDGHVNAMPGDDLSNLDIWSTNITLRLIAAGSDHEKLFVSVSKVPQVPVKSQILKINGEPALAILDRYEKFASGSTRAMRRRAASGQLLDKLGIDKATDPLSIEIQAPAEASSRSVALDRALEVDLPPEKNAPPAKDPTGEALVQARILPENIGYFKVDGFVGTKLPQLFDRVMSQLQGTKALILDLRTNGGGDLSGDHILRWLAKTQIVRYEISPSSSDFLLSQRPDYYLLPRGTEPGFFGWKNLTVDPTSAREGSYAGKPVVALISPYCFSACDTFAAGLKANGLATFVGEATGGGTGSPLVFDLPVSGFKFRYSVVRGKTAGGNWIEGHGTTPDIPVEFSVDDIGKESYADSQALKAIEVAHGLLGTPSTPTQPNGGGVTIINAAKDVNEDMSAMKRELINLQLSERFHE